MYNLCRSAHESDDDYVVEDFVKPDVVRKSINDDSADILGNFDDEKRKSIVDGSYYEELMEQQYQNENTDTDTENSAENENDEMETDNVANNQLSQEQIKQLLKGTAKSNRYVLYVTNLNFETSKDNLMEHFRTKGDVRSIRIPKKRRGGYAFVEMSDLEGYRQGFELHNSFLDGRQIKVQFSEAGKKKSANKKNIMKQKNRKLAEMRQESKAFTKSGKFYDKELKREKAAERRKEKLLALKTNTQN